MSDTPRTDAEMAPAIYKGPGKNYVVAEQFARQLERELTHEKSKRTDTELAAINAELRQQLATAQEDSKRLKRGIDRIGFYFAGTDNHHISDRCLALLRGEHFDSYDKP